MPAPPAGQCLPHSCTGAQRSGDGSARHPLGPCMSGEGRSAAPRSVFPTPLPCSPCHEICFVLCYIGPLPRYFPTFLATCARNETVDFVIVSDQPAPESLGANVRWTHATLASLRDRFSDAVGFPVSLPSGVQALRLQARPRPSVRRRSPRLTTSGVSAPRTSCGAHIRSFATEERTGGTRTFSPFEGEALSRVRATLIRNEPSAKHALRPSRRIWSTPFRCRRSLSSPSGGGGTRERRSLDEIMAAGRLVSFTDVVRWAVESGRVPVVRRGHDR